eukprot:CAMPEP_0198332440 /NCGR_PEP_ID=MMETSP1450-20131203/18286_1 /TAXON_ID=753684 ORGANISM="Madagascaria erythrocladiodes, Strain CCMP3234" /NCGR_SAMPLE_ID=MMETSP1450 /ASSEMBLY_ACC=CAM_ASM_001115 /LENGTH=155 /DNA_ID=CAMNT_0044036895 /DNA_START=110 /DNA_END=573 /DNA_ORIENTATION=+
MWLLRVAVAAAVVAAAARAAYVGTEDWDYARLRSARGVDHADGRFTLELWARVPGEVSPFEAYLAALVGSDGARCASVSISLRSPSFTVGHRGFTIDERVAADRWLYFALAVDNDGGADNVLLYYADGADVRRSQRKTLRCDTLGAASTVHIGDG